MKSNDILKNNIKTSINVTEKFKPVQYKEFQRICDHFRNRNNEKYVIDLQRNNLTESNLALNSFVNLKRPVELNLNRNNINFRIKNAFNRFDCLFNNLDWFWSSDINSRN